MIFNMRLNNGINFIIAKGESGMAKAKVIVSNYAETQIKLNI